MESCVFYQNVHLKRPSRNSFDLVAACNYPDLLRLARLWVWAMLHQIICFQQESVPHWPAPNPDFNIQFPWRIPIILIIDMRLKQYLFYHLTEFSIKLISAEPLNRSELKENFSQITQYISCMTCLLFALHANIVLWLVSFLKISFICIMSFLWVLWFSLIYSFSVLVLRWKKLHECWVHRVFFKIWGSSRSCRQIMYMLSFVLKNYWL